MIVTAHEFNESNKAHAINVLGLIIALVDAGLITDEQIERARITATHAIDQAWAEKMEEAKRE